jgi:hypothetical protein
MIVTPLTGGLAFGATLLLGSVLFWRKTRTNAALLDAIINGQLLGKTRRPRATTSPNQIGVSASQLSRLEGHLRSAILDSGARERLVQHAMLKTGGDRAKAIRQVLDDLMAENGRWS